MAPKKKSVRKTIKAAPKKQKNHRARQVLHRCEEITNIDGAFYRCIRAAGHSGGRAACKFKSEGVEINFANTYFQVRCTNVERIKGRTTVQCTYPRGHKGPCSFDIEPKKRAAEPVHANTSVELFLMAIQEYYADDKLAAGVNMAWLPDKQTWYASVSRYEPIPGAQAPRRLIVCSTECNSGAVGAMQQIMAAWHKLVTRPARPAFREFAEERIPFTNVTL